MGSGNPRIITNTRERALSTDLNRTESFMTYDSHEFSRHLVNREIGGDFYNFPGMQAPYTALPPSSDFLIPHDCLSGLMVRPDNATGLLIDPGEAAFFVPAFANATADDSKYVYVSSPGITSIGDLPFTTNAGPGIRWDIVECQPTEVLTESQSRDIYNPANGQFTSSLVEKVRRGSLTFRIRSGTAGGGIPNPDSAWMPLAAVHVRTDATGFNNCDVYDIRPLVNERCAWSPAHPKSLPTSSGASIGYRLVLPEAEFNLRNVLINGRALEGYFRGHFGGYWSGGAIRRNMPAASLAAFGGTNQTDPNVPYFNPEATENKSASYSIAGDDRFTIGAFFPRGYPRWVRYSELALSPSASNHLRKTGRLPQGPRGLLWLVKDGGRANGAITPSIGVAPAVLGETEGAWGHVVCEGATNGTTEFMPACNGRASNQFMYPVYSVTVASGATPTSRSKPFTSLTLANGTVTTNGGGTLSSIDFTIVRSYPIPPYARAIYVKFNLLVVGTGPTDDVTPAGAYLSLSTPGNPGPGCSVEWQASGGKTSLSSDSWVWDGGFWIPLYASGGFDEDGSGGATAHLSFLIGHNVAPLAVIGQASLEGYQL